MMPIPVPMALAVALGFFVGLAAGVGAVAGAVGVQIPPNAVVGAGIAAAGFVFGPLRRFDAGVQFFDAEPYATDTETARPSLDLQIMRGHVFQSHVATSFLRRAELVARGDPAADPYFRRTDIPQTGHGDASAAATRMFRGDESRRRRGRDADIPSAGRGDAAATTSPSTR